MTEEDAEDAEEIENEYWGVAEPLAYGWGFMPLDQAHVDHSRVELPQLNENDKERIVRMNSILFDFLHDKDVSSRNMDTITDGEIAHIVAYEEADRRDTTKSNIFQYMGRKCRLLRDDDNNGKMPELFTREQLDEIVQDERNEAWKEGVKEGMEASTDES